VARGKPNPTEQRGALQRLKTTQQEQKLSRNQESRHCPTRELQTSLYAGGPRSHNPQGRWIAERKEFLRTLVQEVKLMPEKLTVEIQYRVPQAVMNGLVAGGGFEPPTFGL
jgi:hypothetical protein